MLLLLFCFGYNIRMLKLLLLALLSARPVSGAAAPLRGDRRHVRRFVAYGGHGIVWGTYWEDGDGLGGQEGRQ